MVKIQSLAMIAATTISIIGTFASAAEPSLEWKSPSLVSQESKQSYFSGMYLNFGTGLAWSHYKLKYLNEPYEKNIEQTNDTEVGIGYRFNDHFRTDLNLTFMPVTRYVYKQADGGTLVHKLKSFAVMLNAYYDIVDIGGFTPYMVAGVGSTRNHYTMVPGTYSEHRTDFTWQVGTGVHGKVTDAISWDLGYRYIDKGRFLSKNSYNKSAASNIGLKERMVQSTILASIRLSL